MISSFNLTVFKDESNTGIPLPDERFICLHALAHVLRVSGAVEAIDWTIKELGPTSWMANVLGGEDLIRLLEAREAIMHLARDIGNGPVKAAEAD